MASKKEPYDMKQTFSSRRARQLQQRGWELSGQFSDPATGFTAYTLRRRNARYAGTEIDSAVPTTLLSGADNPRAEGDPGSSSKPSEWNFKWG